VFRLPADQSISQALRSVVRDRLDSAIDLLAESGNLTPKTVHQLRKQFKRLKALFRLVKYLDSQAAETEIRRYRDLGRHLSLSRDRDVVEQTLIKLQFLTDDPAVINRLETLHQRLLKHRLDAPQLPDPDTLRQLLLEARAAAEQVLRGSFSSTSLWESYCQTYQSSRKTWKSLPDSQQQEDWHLWRKRVKDDWYQTQLLTEFRERGTKKRLARLRQLADLLGYDHDLQNLGEIVETLTRRPSKSDAEVLALIDLQRDRIQRDALKLGRKLYRKKLSQVKNQFDDTKLHS